MTAPLVVYVSSSVGSDATGNMGTSASAPLRTLARLSTLYSANRSQDRIFRFACGDVWRESAVFTITNGYPATFESYEKSSGDIDTLGFPKFSGGKVLTNWTASAGNWYSEGEVWLNDPLGVLNDPLTALVNIGTSGAPNMKPAHVHTKGYVLMQGFVPLKRRDARASRTSASFSGTFMPGTLAAGEWAFELATNRIWIGSNPAAGTVEISSFVHQTQGALRMNDVQNANIRELWVGCAPQGLSIDDQTDIRRNLSFEDLIICGAVGNCMTMGGGDNVVLRRIHASGAGNNVITFNAGLQGHLLLEDVTATSNPGFGTGANGYYEDRCFNDLLTLHSHGGSNLTIRRLNASNAKENALDILAGFDLVRVEDSQLSSTGQFVFTTGSKAEITTTTFADSGRGLQFSFHFSKDHTFNAAGSTMDQCVIVGNGNPAAGAASVTSGIFLKGVDSTAEPIRVSRSMISSHPGATRPLVVTGSYQETPPPRKSPAPSGPYYPGRGLVFDNSTLDHQATAATSMFAFGDSVANQGLLTDAALTRCTLQRANASLSLVTVNGSSAGTGFMALPANATSAFGVPSYYAASPVLLPGDVVNPALLSNLPLGLLALGHGECKLGLDSPTRAA
jgi:hypothetical protein